MLIDMPPELDRETCDRARFARDPAYDGLFFVGVRTTRIYCRPVCPARPAKSENVVFFPTAAAAERAGFRPCLRCRPETAPGSPAWSGTATTVARGMRLIEEGFLDEASVMELAERLGIGSRHLLRLSLRHTGATPSEIAATRRGPAPQRRSHPTRRPPRERGSQPRASAYLPPPLFRHGPALPPGNPPASGCPEPPLARAESAGIAIDRCGDSGPRGAAPVRRHRVPEEGVVPHLGR